MIILYTLYSLSKINAIKNIKSVEIFKGKKLSAISSREHPLYVSQQLDLTKKKKLGEKSPSLIYILVLYQLTISVYSVTVRSSCVYK